MIKITRILLNSSNFSKFRMSRVGWVDKVDAELRAELTAIGQVRFSDMGKLQTLQ